MEIKKGFLLFFPTSQVTSMASFVTCDVVFWAEGKQNDLLLIKCLLPASEVIVFTPKSTKELIRLFLRRSV